jgi:hypothetical protein
MMDIQGVTSPAALARNVIDIARLFLFVREVPGNHGQRVNAIQTWGGGKDGDSWCCFLATMILDLYFQGSSPIPRTGSCQQVYQLAQDRGWRTAEPTPGDLYLLINGEGRAHHIGFVTEGDAVQHQFTGLSGNTTEDGTGDNGVCVRERAQNVVPGRVVFVRYPR